MKKIFIGLFFVFINFNVNGLELMPAFVGYILIYLGLGEEGECPSFKTARLTALVGALVSGVIWLLSFSGRETLLPVGPVFQLFATYWLVVWAEEMASLRGWSVDRVERFRAGWYALAIFGVLTVVLYLVFSEMALLTAVAFVGVGLFYIYTFYHIWKDRPPAEGAAE